MPYIVRDENGGERDPYEDYIRGDIVDFERWEMPHPYRKGNRSYEHWGEDLRNRERMLEEAQRMSDSIGSEIKRIEVIPYSEEETNARKWGLLNSLVDLIKRTGGGLMDRYQKNKEDRRKWQKENPGGYPGMPQHLRERMRRNESSAWMPREDALIAHVNADGTAHDYREPGHINFRVPGGELNPHGRRGGITYSDGRAKYSPEEIFMKMKAGELDINSHKYDDRFWSPETQPGDGSSLTPEAQRLYDSIWS